MEISVVKSAPARWLAEGCSVRGASHERNGKPNQDHLVRRSLTEGGAVIAVADGHGSAKYFRSEVGSKLAVEVALDLITEMMEGVTCNNTPLDKVTTNVKDVLPRKIVEEWRRRVKEHWNSHESLTDAEAEMLKDNAGVQEVVDNDHTVAYGCTLLAAAVTARYLVLVQNGDGDIICVSQSGKAQRPLPDDPRLIANETTSLCQPQAETNFRAYVQQLDEDAPAVVILSSDGCANSFEGDEFLTWVEQFALKVRDYGLKPVSEQLDQWLEQITRGGSGDDVTFGILAREELQSRGDNQEDALTALPGAALSGPLPVSDTGTDATLLTARTKPVLTATPVHRTQMPLKLLFLPLGIAVLALVARQAFSPKRGP